MAGLRGGLAVGVLSALIGAAVSQPVEAQPSKTTPVSTPPSSSSPAPAASSTPPAKPAPVGADPVSTSATYGDWVLRCQRVGEGDKTQRVCEVAQTIQVQGQQSPIAQIALGRLGAADPLKVTVALPTNISLPGTVTMALNDKDPSPMPMTWRRCLPGACIADAVPSADALKAFRAAGDPGRLVFKDATGRDVTLPFSFRGLAQALDALTKA